MERKDHEANRRNSNFNRSFACCWLIGVGADMDILTSDESIGYLHERISVLEAILKSYLKITMDVLDAPLKIDKTDWVVRKASLEVMITDVDKFHDMLHKMLETIAKDEKRGHNEKLH